MEGFSGGGSVSGISIVVSCVGYYTNFTTAGKVPELYSINIICPRRQNFSPSAKTDDRNLIIMHFVFFRLISSPCGPIDKTLFSRNVSSAFSACLPFQ